ncbi:MAG: hypothetical protein ACOYMW_04845 [Candidatus Competibacteraceae bacterium]
MSFKVNKIAAAVAVSLGTSVVGMNVAQADAVFFPYLIASPAVTTILSLIDEGSANAQVHYRYYYKRDAGSAEANRLSGCTEADYPNNSSPNDIVTFDISNVFGADRNGVLFEGTTGGPYDDFAIFRNQTIRANAVVDNDFAGFTFGRNVNGEAFIIEFASGSVWGYSAYNAAEILTYTAAGTFGAGRVVVNPVNEFDFSDRAEVNGEVLVEPPTFESRANIIERYRVPIAIMPFAQVTTRLFVTPINPNTPFQVPVERNLYTAGIRLEVNDNTTLQQVMFDRDEQPVSGRVTKNIVCVGAVDVPEMINEAIRSRVANGGWSNVGIVRGGLPSPSINVNQAIVLKLEYGVAVPPATQAALDGVLVGSGSYNNGYWLRKGIRESVPRNLIPGTGGYPVLPVFQMPDAAQDVNAPYPTIIPSQVVAYNLLAVAANRDPLLLVKWVILPEGPTYMEFVPGSDNTVFDYFKAAGLLGSSLFATYDQVKSAL